MPRCGCLACSLTPRRASDGRSDVNLLTSGSGSTANAKTGPSELTNRDGTTPVMSDNQWEQAASILRRRSAERYRQQEERRQAEISRDHARRLNNHQRRFHCKECGCPSSGPERYDGGENSSWIDWNRSENLSKCYECHRLVHCGRCTCGKECGGRLSTGMLFVDTAAIRH